MLTKPGDPKAMYVRALYDYVTDDKTSLSFHQGDVIQVIDQLESGWWDGLFEGVRGWFPSNYCALITDLDAPIDPIMDQDPHADNVDDDDFADAEQGDAGNGAPADDDPSFWIAQATQDGRLFYFNTVTGKTVVDLPLETPAPGETGPRDVGNIPDRTRVPPELLKDDESPDEATNSEKEGEKLMLSQVSMAKAQGKKRSSYMSDGVSPTASIHSLNAANMSRTATNDAHIDPYVDLYGIQSMRSATAAVPSSFFNKGTTPLTWDRLVDDMRYSVERYRHVVNEGDRSEYVRKAEDISDHLRLLLAAGSGTTDNHSGHPSIISTNKALYPHFRDMMSRFSKLVLSSHIAAADWPAADSHTKCLQEADGVLNGVYGYVDVARQQRGEDVPRLFPGFLAGEITGGNWQNNGLTTPHDYLAALNDPDEFENIEQPSVTLDATVMDQVDKYRELIATSLRKLGELLVVPDKLVTPRRHNVIADQICSAAMRTIECVRPYLAALESINLAALGLNSSNPSLADFSIQKQRLYDLTSDLIVGCQAIAGPLADEWNSYRDGDTLEDRLAAVKIVSQQLNTCMGQLTINLQFLLESMSTKAIKRELPGKNARNEGDGYNGDYSKVERLLGEQLEKPAYLRLDYEDEISWDPKTNPPQLRGGTLRGLVELLTRHDALDSDFNKTFLLTYRSFTTAPELFEMLVTRYTIKPPPDLSSDEFKQWSTLKQNVIRLRVVNILKTWLEKYWMENPEDPNTKALLKRASLFAKESVAESHTPGSGPLISVIDQRVSGQEMKVIIPTMSTVPPAPIVPKNMKRLKFLDVDSTEFARQLTIIEQRLYMRITPAECLNKQGKAAKQEKKEGEPETGENIRALILHSNQLTNWVAEMILNQSDVRKRVAVIKHFISVAEKCRALNNFSALFSIICALGASPIDRLKRTWDQVPQRTLQLLESMRTLMGSTRNFGVYRDMLRNANPPCIPFFGVFLTDLTFIEDGIPSLIKNTNLINFSKRMKVAEVIRDIQQFQSTQYPLQPVPELIDYVISNMQAARDVGQMYETSLSVEPREKEEERVARLLSESGFL